jgi:hypothetical protein
MPEKLIFYFLILISVSFCSCQANEACSKFMGEVYLNEPLDSSMQKNASIYRDTLLKRFEETSIKGLNHQAYHLQFYSSHGFGQSIKFEQKGSEYVLNVRCITKGDWYPDCDNYQITITKEEWDQFEEMIYSFNFWTAQTFKTNQGVLDGYVYFLEGTRPEAENCNKRTYHFVGRGSPRYDKMGALCDYIREYEDQLAQRHGKRTMRQTSKTGH